MAEKWLIYHSKAYWLKFFDSVSLFIVSYKLRPWQELAYHAQKRWCKKVGKVLNSTLGVMNQIRRVKGAMLTFMVRSPSFPDSCKNIFQNTLPQNPPASLAIRQWYKKFGAPALAKDNRKSEGRSFQTDIQHFFFQQVVQQQVNTQADVLDNGYVY